MSEIKKIEITNEIYQRIKLMMKSENIDDRMLGIQTWKNLKPSKLLCLILVKEFYGSARLEVINKLQEYYYVNPEPWCNILSKINVNSLPELEQELITTATKNINIKL